MAAAAGDPFEDNAMWTYLIAAAFLVALGLCAFALWSVTKRLAAVERRFTEATPFYKYVLKETGAAMMHDEPWAAELDELITEQALEPDVMMSPDRYERLKELVAEVAKGTRPGLRVGEPDAARVYLAALPLARAEANSNTPLTGVRLVGSQAPTPQTTKEREDAGLNDS